MSLCWLRDLRLVSIYEVSAIANTTLELVKIIFKIANLAQNFHESRDQDEILTANLCVLRQANSQPINAKQARKFAVKISSTSRKKIVQHDFCLVLCLP